MTQPKLRTPIAATLLILQTIVNVVCLIVMSAMGVPQTIRSILPILLDLILCVILFKKKKDNTLVFVMSAYMLKSLINLFPFSIRGIVTLAAYALVLVLVIAFSDQTLIGADWGAIKKHRKTLQKVVFILFIAATFMNTSLSNDILALFLSGIFESIFSLLHIFALLSLINWLENPYMNTDEDYDNAYCPMVKHILLCLFTCGVWIFIWVYKVTKYLNKAPNCEYYNPTSKLLLCMFVPFYQIYWLYKQGQRIDIISQGRNNNSNTATLCLILGIFIPFVAVIIMQDKINQLCLDARSENVVGQEA